MQEYLASLRENRNSHYKSLYKHNYKSFLLSVSNDGNSVANDLRVDIKIPTTLLVFEEFPKDVLKERPMFPKFEVENQKRFSNFWI